MLRDEDFRHFRDEAGWIFDRLSYGRLTRKIIIKPFNIRGEIKYRIYPVEEDVYLVDTENRIVYTTDEDAMNKVCYTSEFLKKPICFPEKSVYTDPDIVNTEPLDRNYKEEAIIAVEEELEDDFVLAHFSYYCRTRGGVPIFVDVKEGLEVVCVGGKVDGYGVLSENVSRDVLVIRGIFDDPAKAYMIYQMGRKPVESAERVKIIIPKSRLKKFPIEIENV